MSAKTSSGSTSEIEPVDTTRSRRTGIDGVTGIENPIDCATVPVNRYLGAGRSVRTSSSIHLLAVLLTLFTAAVHLYLFLQDGAVVMLLAALGFLGGIGLFVTGIERRYRYVAGIAYTVIQLGLWVVAGMPHLASFGTLDKVAQVLLIVVLAYLSWTGR